MNCPRCGISAPADRSACPACSWQLSRPFDDVPVDSAHGNNGAAAGGQVALQTAADAFALTPPSSLTHAQHPQRSLARRWGRRAWHRRREPPRNGSAVAVLPEEARWEAPPRLEVIELPLVQTSFDFSAEPEAEILPAPSRVASLEARLNAGLLDAGLILGAALGFFALFAALGGSLGVDRRDLLVYLLVCYSLASAYFGFFTLVGGRTPGMRACRLGVLTFEGQPLTRQHALWRAFGYAVSAGSLLLGFLWAAVDERHLSWHDLVSRTFITDRTLL